MGKPTTFLHIRKSTIFHLIFHKLKDISKTISFYWTTLYFNSESYKLNDNKARKPKIIIIITEQQINLTSSNNFLKT